MPIYALFDVDVIVRGVGLREKEDIAARGRDVLAVVP